MTNILELGRKYVMVNGHEIIIYEIREIHGVKVAYGWSDDGYKGGQMCHMFELNGKNFDYLFGRGRVDFSANDIIFDDYQI